MATRARGPSRGLLLVLCALAAASALWSLFLWISLLRARQELGVFCPLGDGAACAALWDSAFAGAVHGWTGLPIAGWGLVWGLVALAVAGSLLRTRRKLLLGALVASAFAGALALAVLIAASVAVGSACASCVVMYVLVAAFALPVLVTARGLSGAELARGVGAAGLLSVLAFALLLYPGLRTPATAVAALTEATAPAGAEEPASLDERLERFLAELSPPDRSALAEALRDWAAAPHFPRPARGLHGSAEAPVVVTDFTDSLCGHCASFHSGIEALMQLLPDDAFALDERQFPLDAACNPAGPPQGPGPSVRCRAALARICMEQSPHAFEYSGDLFRSQRSLTVERVLVLAGRYADAGELETCMQAAETGEKLRADIEWALEHGLEGTPMALVNGRRALASPGFLYALILARGEASHPAFARLEPAPQSAAPEGD